MKYEFIFCAYDDGFLVQHKLKGWVETKENEYVLHFSNGYTKSFSKNDNVTRKVIYTAPNYTQAVENARKHFNEHWHVGDFTVVS